MKPLKFIDNILDFIAKETRLFKKQYKTCPNKHTVYNNNDKYCWQCGAQLNITLNNPLQKPMCPKCKKIADRADDYCTKCGEQLII